MKLFKTRLTCIEMAKALVDITLDAEARMNRDPDLMSTMNLNESQKSTYIKAIISFWLWQIKIKSQDTWGDNERTFEVYWWFSTHLRGRGYEDHFNRAEHYESKARELSKNAMSDPTINFGKKLCALVLFPITGEKYGTSSMMMTAGRLNGILEALKVFLSEIQLR